MMKRMKTPVSKNPKILSTKHTNKKNPETPSIQQTVHVNTNKSV